MYLFSAINVLEHGDGYNVYNIGAHEPHAQNNRLLFYKSACRLLRIFTVLHTFSFLENIALYSFITYQS
jgi:hypothetical protein